MCEFDLATQISYFGLPEARAAFLHAFSREKNIPIDELKKYDLELRSCDVEISLLDPKCEDADGNTDEEIAMLESLQRKRLILRDMYGFSADDHSRLSKTGRMIATLHQTGPRSLMVNEKLALF